jgi:hypothetical protein
MAAILTAAEELEPIGEAGSFKVIWRHGPYGFKTEEIWKFENSEERAGLIRTIQFFQEQALASIGAP